ncbi:MAG: flavodoxin domain-containing protein [Bacteroidales bacterium]|jgi:menaquinone-dependent protoporphyrinogen oxidase|nr:flavodoxin domain-containing protein [Bacteroidales bacterium]
MNTAIIYATREGCTEKCAHTLAIELETNIEIFNIELDKNINLLDFETVIIGGSIHMGLINKKIKNFIDKNIEPLSEKKLGLFICCMYEGEKAQEQFRNAFPEKLRDNALAHGFFGGAFDFDKMNFFEKAIVKKVANIDHSSSKISLENIKSFAENMSK